MTTSRFRSFLEKYGKVAVITHCSISAASITGLYIAINNNVDVQSAIDKINIFTTPPKEEEDMFLCEVTDRIKYSAVKSCRVVAQQKYSYAAPVAQQQSIERPTSADTLAIPTFNPTDDPIESLNKAMIFSMNVFNLARTFDSFDQYLDGICKNSAQESPCQGFVAALAVLNTGALSQSRQNSHE
ncbi:beta-galactosidase 10 [Tanacetum coccineum]